MSSESQELSLADICSDVNYGYTESATNEPVGPKFLRITDIQGGTLDWNVVPYCPATDANANKYRLEIGDIVVARTGNSTGENAQINNEPPLAVFASYLIRFRPDVKQVNPFFIGYQLRSDRFRQHVLAVRGGSAQPGANAKQLGAFPIRLIPRLLQDDAVEILRSIDDRIALLRETNATLESIAQAMFKSWFVDFDPVHANATLPSPRGRGAGGEGNNASRHPHPSPLPAGEGVQSMSVAIPARGTPVCAPGVPPDPSAAAALFPDSFEESELGLVPRGWRTSAVYDLAKYINGAAYKAFEPNSEQRGLPIIKIAELKAGVTKQTGYSDVSMPEKYRIAAGDILFSWSGNPDTSIDTFVWLHGDAWLNQHIFRVVPTTSSERSFVLMTLKYLNPIFAEIARNKQTTGLGHVTVADLKRLRVVKPSDAVLQQWNEIVDPLIERAFNVQQQAQTLATLRDTLLPRLISGQLRLPEAEALLEELA